MTVEPEPSHRPDLFNGIDQKWALPGDGSAALQLSAPTFLQTFQSSSWTSNFAKRHVARLGPSRHKPISSRGLSGEPD